MVEQCPTPDRNSVWTLGLTSKRFSILLVSIVGFFPLVVVLLGPKLVFYVGSIIGFYLRKKTAGRKEQILETVEQEEKDYAAGLKEERVIDEWESVEADVDAKNGQAVADRDWDGIVGFFHPFCNAGGGGERVLWAAIRATQKRWPKAKCVVYTGDHDADKASILKRVKDRFNIRLHPPTVNFLYLTTRSWVLASSWPSFTLLGQSIGSLVLAWDAFSLLPPDIFIDTMGYAFTLGMSKILFADVPTGAYVHYPTISMDMLGSLDPKSATGNLGVNAGKGQGAAGKAKKIYWELFAKLYSFIGGSVDDIMTNSTWTQEHINSLWGGWRKEFKKPAALPVYPPVAVEELEKEVEVSAESEKRRQKVLLYIAQFRPEKNHKLILASFAEFMKTRTEATKGARLVLIGSIREDDPADAKRVYELRLLANELQIKDSVEFHLNASWPEILEWLRKASIGVNGMWNEHFGIGVVEYQAAGLISVVHDSGGPKRDIVIEIDGQPTGFHATTSTDFANGFEKALSLPNKLEMRLRARKSAQRFTEEEFAKGWIKHMEVLVTLRKAKE